MGKDLKSDVKQRFDDAFGIERLPLFAIHIAALELDGHYATARVLKELLEDELTANGASNLYKADK